MAELKIEQAEARDTGPWIMSQGHWAGLSCHGGYIAKGYIPIVLNGSADNIDFRRQFKVDWPGDDAAGSAPGRWTGTRDPIALEIGRQWRAILESPAVIVPKLGPIALNPVKVKSESYEAHMGRYAADRRRKTNSTS